jgi:glycosyltransferase involved in cell wall biosynthesis
MPQPLPISVYFVSGAEAHRIGAALESVQGWATEIVVILQQEVSDGTEELARSWGARVIREPWKGFVGQKASGLEKTSAAWTLNLDADEVVTPELKDEISKAIAEAGPEIGAFSFPRCTQFLGRWIRHGGYYPTWLLRVWRNGLGICEQRWMDEHIILSQGETADLKYDIIDENQKGLTFWTDKHNRYADREVKDLLGMMVDEQDNVLNTNQLSQASQRRWVKKNFYGRSPLFFRAFIYFLMRYIIGLGFLDGTQGLIFHFLQGFWYRFLVDAKLYEIRRSQ